MSINKDYLRDQNLLCKRIYLDNTSKKITTESSEEEIQALVHIPQLLQERVLLLLSSMMILIQVAVPVETILMI